MDSQTIFFLFAIFYFFSFLFLFLFIFIIFKVFEHLNSFYVTKSRLANEIDSINSYFSKNNAQWTESHKNVHLLTERVKTLETWLLSSFDASQASSSASSSNGYATT